MTNTATNSAFQPADILSDDAKPYKVYHRRITITVPTVAGNKQRLPQPLVDQEHTRVELTFCQLFGGCTSAYYSQGCWLDDAGALHKEDVRTVETYAMIDTAEDNGGLYGADLAALCYKLGRTLQQKSVMITIDNEAYFMDTEQAGYGPGFAQTLNGALLAD